MGLGLSLLFLFLTFVYLERNEVVIISDLHLGSYWFTGEKNNNTCVLKNFLNSLIGSESVHTLIINGDFIDRWLIPFDETPISPVKQLESTNYKGVNIKIYIDLVKEIKNSGIDVIFISGNHDDTMKKEYYSSVGLDVSYYYDFLELQNIHVEHGHRFEPVCMDDPATLVPFGYYAARAMAYSGGLLKEKYRKEPSYILCEIIEDLGLIQLIENSKYFVEIMLSYSLGDKFGTPFLEKYEKLKHRNFESGCFFWDLVGKQNVTIEMVAKKYQSFLKRLVEKFGMEKIKQDFRTQCDDYRYFLEISSTDLVVFGHTHVPLMRRLKKKNSEENVVYANTGSWIDTALYFPVVKINKTKDGDATFVRLMSFNPKTLECETIDSSILPYKGKIQETGLMGKGGTKSKEGEFRAFLTLKQKEEDISIPEAPEGWLCDPHFYDNDDGCDCNCGIWDPDCGPKKDECTHFCIKGNCGNGN